MKSIDIVKQLLGTDADKSIHRTVWNDDLIVLRNVNFRCRKYDRVEILLSKGEAHFAVRPTEHSDYITTLKLAIKCELVELTTTPARSVFQMSELETINEDTEEPTL